MAKVKKKSNGPIGFLVVVLFLSFAGLLSVKTGVIDLGGLKKTPAYENDLVKTVSFQGPIKAKDLHLSQSEVRHINNAVMKNSTTFSGMNLELDVWDYEWPVKIEQTTVLDCAIVLDIDAESQVRSWSSKVRRTDLVPHMVRYIERCAAELKRYNDNPELKKTPEMKGFRRIYM